MITISIFLSFIGLILFYMAYVFKKDDKSYLELLYDFFTDPSYNVSADKFAGGNGSKDDPYLIKNPGQLDKIRNHLDYHFKLISDINMEIFCKRKKWEPIGKNNYNSFTGSFDGNNFKIINLTIEDNNKKNVGFFGYSGNVEKKSVIKNLILENLTVIGANRCGGLVGNNYGLIKNCEVRGKVSGKNTIGGLVGNTWGHINNSKFYGEVNGGDKIGGLIGRTDQGVNISECYVNGEIKGGNTVGGLIGENSGAIENAIVERCYTKVNIEEGLGGVGGLVGINHGIIRECFTECKIEAGISVGGLVGGNEKIIKNCYSNGEVSGINNIGGLVGWDSGNYLNLNADSIINCYTSVNISSDEKSGNLVGRTDRNIKSSYFLKEFNYQGDYLEKGNAVNAYDMMQKQTFIDWDFENIWIIDNGREYPNLRWFHEYYYN